MNEMELNRRGFISSLAVCFAWTKKSKAKSIVSPAASASQPTCSMDEAAQRDGSNVIDTVVCVPPQRGICVNNPNRFQAGQSVDIYTGSIPHRFKGSMRIVETVDWDNTIRIGGGVPRDVCAGDLLVVHGAGSLMDIPYHQISGDTGAYLGLSRS